MECWDDGTRSHCKRLNLDQRSMCMGLSVSQHVRGKNPRSLKRLLAIRGRGSAHAALHVCQSRTPRARSHVAACRTDRQVFGSDGPNLIQFRRIPPDVNKLLPPYISTRERKLHTREYISIRSDVSRRMSGAARIAFHDIFPRSWRRRAELFHISHQIFVVEDCVQL